MIPNLNSTVESIPEALSIYVNQIVYDKKSRGERVYTFSLGEAYFNIPQFEVTKEDFIKGYHYCSSLGQPKLRYNISKLYKDFYATNVNPETEILVSTGSKPIIFMLLQTVLNTGEEVLVHEPAWLSYKEQIKLAGGKYKAIPYNKVVSEWESYITPLTKVIIINNPNNPSGQLYTKKELELLLNLAEKHNLFILSDEAYSDFITAENKFLSFASIDKSKEHCLVVNSLSKNLGMSGWRIGYSITHPTVNKQLLKLNQHLITCASTILQNYLADHLFEILQETLPQARQMAEKRKKVQVLLDKLGIDSMEGVGTFYFLLNIDSFPGTTEELVYDLLLNHNIATVPGAAYGDSTRRFIRFGIGVETLDDIENCLKLIKTFLNKQEYNPTPIRSQMKDLGII